MASVIEAIRDILRPGIFEERALVLREADPGSRCPAIALSKRGKALMIRPDQVPASGISPPDRLFPLFNIQKDGICQLCDYLVFYPQPHPSSGGSDLFVSSLSSRAARRRAQSVNCAMESCWLTTFSRSLTCTPKMSSGRGCTTAA